MPPNDNRGFEIGQPAAELPSAILRDWPRRTRYGEIYAKLAEMQDGSWLPVVCETKGIADSLAMALRLNRRYKFQVCQRGRTVWARKRPIPEGADPTPDTRHPEPRS
jgi:hypothetical protein